jgi:hypothetical protein
MRRADSPFDNMRTIAASVCAVVLAVAAVWYWQRSAAPDVGPASPHRHRDVPIRQGPLNDAGPAPRIGVLLPQIGALAPAPDSGPKIDSFGHLVPDLALRRLIDSFLSNTQTVPRQQRALELRAYLKGRLVAPANDEAERIVTSYLAYLDAQDRMLARERRAAPVAESGLSERAVEGLLAWQEQRAQLRRRLLGDALTRAWFEADDARCTTVLHDWLKQFAPPDPTQEPDFAELRERRLHGAALEAMRSFDAESCATQIRLGFAGDR